MSGGGIDDFIMDALLATGRITTIGLLLLIWLGLLGLAVSALISAAKAIWRRS
jgi:hypothetical protein